MFYVWYPLSVSLTAAMSLDKYFWKFT